MTAIDSGLLTLELLDGKPPIEIDLRQAEWNSEEEIIVERVAFEYDGSGLKIWHGYQEFEFIPMHHIRRFSWDGGPV